LRLVEEGTDGGAIKKGGNDMAITVRVVPCRTVFWLAPSSTNYSTYLANNRTGPLFCRKRDAPCTVLRYLARSSPGHRGAIAPSIHTTRWNSRLSATWYRGISRLGVNSAAPLIPPSFTSPYRTHMICSKARWNHIPRGSNTNIVHDSGTTQPNLRCGRACCSGCTTRGHRTLNF
jgi:hypothetical protein